MFMFGGSWIWNILSMFGVSEILDNYVLSDFIYLERNDVNCLLLSSSMFFKVKVGFFCFELSVFSYRFVMGFV